MRGALRGTTAGEYGCEYTLGYACGRGHANFDADEICYYGCNDSELRAVVCHETGHSVGLVHGEDAYDHAISNQTGSLYCMQTDINPLLLPYQLGSHNADQINVVY